MAGANASSGELIVFADGDCLYERTWLEALLAPFSDPSVSIVGGETAINSAGPYGLAVAIASSFPARARSDSPYRSDRYHLNNVAFRRRVLQDVPIPSRQPCYRMSGLHAARLLARGYTILRQPSARAVHAAPNGLSHFVWRFLLMGFDGVVVPRLIAKESKPADRSRVQRRRTFGLIRFWAAQAIIENRGRASRQTVAFAGTAPRAACLCVRSCAAGDRRVRRARRAAAVPRRGARRNPPGEHVRTSAGAHRGPFASSEGRLDHSTTPEALTPTGRRSSRDARTMRRAANAAMDLRARKWP